MEAEDPGVLPDLEHYIAERFAAEDETLRTVRATIASAGLPDISVSPTQGKLLHLFALMVKAERILEIGTLGGYSTIWLARALPEGGKLISLELEETHAEVARRNLVTAGLDQKAEVRVGPAVRLLGELASTGEPPFDLIFIDADKPPYLQYFQLAVGLSRPGTLIIADNVIRHGKILDPDHPEEEVEGVQRLNDHLAVTAEAVATVLPTVGIKGLDGFAIALVT